MLGEATAAGCRGASCLGGKLSWGGKTLVPKRAFVVVNFSNFVRGGAAFAIPLSRNPTRPCLLAAGCERSLGSRIAASCAWLGGGGDGGSSGGGGSGSVSAALSSSPLGGLRSRVAARWAEGFLGASAFEHPGIRPLFPLFPFRLGGIDRAVYNMWE